MDGEAFGRALGAYFVFLACAGFAAGVAFVLAAWAFVHYVGYPALRWVR